jgi:hypothetical protein
MFKNDISKMVAIISDKLLETVSECSLTRSVISGGIATIPGE